MHGYDPATWATFLAAEVGASAALAGLLVVTVSINLERILAFAKLPARAFEALLILLLLLAVASLSLAPQSSRLVGAEVLVLAGAVCLSTLVTQVRHGPDSPGDPVWWFVARMLTTQLATLPFVFAGLSLVIRQGGGFYWFVPGTILTFAGAFYSTWVLLVEIARARTAGNRET